MHSHPAWSPSPRARLRLCLLSAALCLTACGQAEDDKAAGETGAAPAGKASEGRAERVVHIGYQKIGPPFLLKSRSKALDERLAALGARAEWIEFAAGPPILEAMRGGSVDVGYVGETPPIFAQAGGVPFVYLAADPPAPRAEAIVVPKNSAIQKVADLRGRKVALNRGSNVHYLLVRALASEKLTLADIQLLFLAPADARAAFDSGQLDAWVIWDPFLAAAELAGARTLRDGEGLVDNHIFYVARRAFAETQPDLIEALLAEFQALSEWEQGHPEEAARLLAESSRISYEALLVAEKRHSYGVQRITPAILAKQQTIADTLHGLQVIPKAIQTRDAVAAGAGKP